MKKITAISAFILICVMLFTSCSFLGSVNDALFGPDYEKITNNIFTKYIEMNVSVITVHKSRVKEYESQGSGVIYAEDNRYYYLLTNAHVIESDSEFPQTIYTIYDCYANEYNGTLVHADPSYDLAVLRIVKGSEPLCVVAFAENDAKKGTKVVTLGTSNGLINSVTYGEIQNYDTVELHDKNGNVDNRVSFPVVWHSAPMWGGGSGSVLLNMDMELVGINFAVATDNSGAFIYGFAISATKVHEYLKNNNLVK